MQHTAGLLAAVLEHVGDTRRAEELLETLAPPETYGVPRALAIYHLIRGEGERAVDWFEKMIDQRDNIAVFMPRLPYAKALRASPRWPALAKRMNLPAEAW
jgi:eukaryotic-like serine/threonine-protein kinase